MEDALRAARFGSRMVFLEGAAGTGKTRLASLVARSAIEQGFIVLAGRCTDPPHQAYQPIATAIEWISRTSPAVLLRAGIDEQCGPLAWRHPWPRRRWRCPSRRRQIRSLTDTRCWRPSGRWSDG